MRSTMLNIAAFAPIPRASVATTAVVKGLGAETASGVAKVLPHDVEHQRSGGAEVTPLDSLL